VRGVLSIGTFGMLKRDSGISGSRRSRAIRTGQDAGGGSS
jgi:hypothetical protein